MAYTVKYCDTCNRALSPSDKSPEAKVFLKAKAFERKYPRDHGAISEQGSCAKCGYRGIVSYYEIATDQP